MTIDIEGKVYFKRYGSDDPWKQTTLELTKMIPDQYWEISLDGITAMGLLESFREGNGGHWSQFKEDIYAGERRLILIRPDIFVSGK